MVLLDKLMAPCGHRLMWGAKNEMGLNAPPRQSFHSFSIPHYRKAGPDGLAWPTGLADKVPIPLQDHKAPAVT
jgi:hypothetical protein